MDTPVRPPRRSRRTVAVGAALAMALVLVAAGVVLWQRHQHEQEESASDRGSLTAAQYATAVGVARAEIAQESKGSKKGPTVSRAVATVVTGGVRQPNVSSGCTSGHVLVVSLEGEFPGVNVSPARGAATGPDMWVTVKADAASGEECLVGVSFGVFQAPSGSANLTPAL